MWFETQQRHIQKLSYCLQKEKRKSSQEWVRETVVWAYKMEFLSTVYCDVFQLQALTSRSPYRLMQAMVQTPPCAKKNDDIRKQLFLSRNFTWREAIRIEGDGEMDSCRHRRWTDKSQIVTELITLQISHERDPRKVLLRVWQKVSESFRGTSWCYHYSAELLRADNCRLLSLGHVALIAPNEYIYFV